MVDLVVKNKIKEVVKLRISADLHKELSKRMEELLKRAEERAKANHRTTILGQDL